MPAPVAPPEGTDTSQARERGTFHPARTAYRRSAAGSPSPRPAPVRGANPVSSIALSPRRPTRRWTRCVTLCRYPVSLRRDHRKGARERQGSASVLCPPECPAHAAGRAHSISCGENRAVPARSSVSSGNSQTHFASCCLKEVLARISSVRIAQWPSGGGTSKDSVPATSGYLTRTCEE